MSLTGYRLGTALLVDCISFYITDNTASVVQRCRQPGTYWRFNTWFLLPVLTYSQCLLHTVCQHISGCVIDSLIHRVVE